jgi:hypothetical protein
MLRGGSQHGTGWAAPSCCSLLRWKTVFFSWRCSRMVRTTRRSWSKIQPWSSQGSKCCTLWVKRSAQVFYLRFWLLPRRQNVLKNPRTPAKMKCCVTSGSGYYPHVEEGLFWILCAYIEVYTWTTIKTNWFN